jgi:SulP family sulfate permease
VLKQVHREAKSRGTKIVLSGVSSEQVLDELKNSRLLFAIGKANIAQNLEKALLRSRSILAAKDPLLL